MDIGDRIVWIGGLNADGSSKGGWAGNCRGRVAGYEKARPYFEGTSPGTKDAPPKGPAVRLVIDQGWPDNPKQHDVWVVPSSKEIVPDPEPLPTPASFAPFLREEPAEAYEAP